MGHEDEDIIILSVSVSPRVAARLDNLIGIKGATREEVASHDVSAAHGEPGIRADEPTGSS